MNEFDSHYLKIFDLLEIMKERKNILIDIDGTVSEDIPNEESNRFGSAYVLENSVQSVNKLFEEGHSITFFTARQEKHREVTLKWLTDHGFKFHGLLMGKPRGGNYVWIDNLDVEGVLYKNNWNELVEKFT